MTIKKVTVAALFSVGLVAMDQLPVEAQDGILFKERAGTSNYCHMKFPAIREETLSWDRPVLQNPSTGTIIDFYGSCDYDPTGKAAIEAQRRAKQRRLFREQE